MHLCKIHNSDNETGGDLEPSTHFITTAFPITKGLSICSYIWLKSSNVFIIRYDIIMRISDLIKANYIYAAPIKISKIICSI